MLILKIYRFFTGKVKVSVSGDFAFGKEVYGEVTEVRSGTSNGEIPEGCAVLVSSAVGSASFLVQDGKNGMIYKYGSQRDMNKKLLALAMDKKLRDSLGKEAFLSIRGEYSAEVAVERLVAFVESGNKKEMIFNQGPVSTAPVIKNKWYK